MPLKLYSRLLKNLHCARPKVWAPDKATRSVSPRPTAENLDWRILKLFKGLGRLLAPVMFAVVPSLLPSNTDHEGPPAKLTEASAARARISAHETTPGQAFSTAVLMLSTTLKPRIELLFGTAPFSLTMVELLSNKTDPSQPSTKQSWKKRRVRLAVIRISELWAC